MFRETRVHTQTGSGAAPFSRTDWISQFCDFHCSHSALERRKAKSSGNRSILRLTAWFSVPGGTPYRAARSASTGRLTRAQPTYPQAWSLVWCAIVSEPSQRGSYDEWAIKYATRLGETI